MKKAYISMPFYETTTLNVTESIFKFRNGSAIHIEGTDDSVKIHGYHCDILWINEGYNVSKDTFDQLDMRCSKFVILDLNPRQDHWSEDVAKYPNACLINSTFKDNPFVPEQQRAKILSYQPVKLCSCVIDGRMTEQQAKLYDLEFNGLDLTDSEVAELTRCRENEYHNSSNEFNWLVYGTGQKAERPNRIFHWNEISLDEYLKIDAKKYYGVDWGAVDPWGILEAKYYDGCLYLHEINYLSENKIRERLTPSELNQIENSEEGFVKWYFNKFQISKNDLIICDPNRTSKILALRAMGYDYAIAASKPSGSIIDGIDLLNRLRVYYTHTSANLKYEQENYSRKVDRFGIVQEEPEDNNNHLADPSRYIASYLLSDGIIKNI